MSNQYFEKRNAIRAKYKGMKADIQVESEADIRSLENKPFYSHREMRKQERDALMMAACAMAIGLLIGLAIHII